MPLWADLGKALAEDMPDFTASGAIDSISAYEHEYGRARLVERLSQLLHVKDAQPGEVHKQFCSLPFDIVCTTNFDFLLERQYDLTPRYVYPVVDEEQLSIDGANAGTQDRFLEELATLIHDAASDLPFRQRSEPSRLLEVREYRAAIISAMSLLEAQLRLQLGKEPWDAVRRPLTLRAIVDRAINQGLIPHDMRADMETWIKLRNARGTHKWSSKSCRGQRSSRRRDENPWVGQLIA